MTNSLQNVVNVIKHPLSDADFQVECKNILDKNGVLLLPDFLTRNSIESIRREGLQQQHLAYFSERTHNIYLSEPDSNFPDRHPRNRQITSTKGCITTDQIPQDSCLHLLYNSNEFKSFLCSVLNEKALHPYADSMSSINLHYADKGQQLGWHFDNSSFAITLLIQEPQSGGEFEYVKDVRDADAGDVNYAIATRVLDGEITAKKLSLKAGTLLLFRGRNAMHRVTPVIGETTRMLVVLAYNSEPGIALSKSARMTFYGRV
ncbi:MAG: 2OG-Fe(II) oxygenase [Gammaproteobacteria bacterium]|nr:2OG-Fe(II) oxygenase [Gammaproteobacteria bacterium]NNC97080.1 2OG-Fe(II) oxygenase [Gammaproteobacteria bacterium]NNM14067.1 2OG-Fe(II) oxygenase [Gammaproteobacteria bacterium]